MSAPVAAIIAEYNPFHNGHAYQIAEVRSKLPDVRIIAIMSGSFTQRGEPALLDKWTRARLAVQSGCDLVLELPFAFSCRSAQDFALGGIRLAAGLTRITHLAFGAETPDLALLQKIASIIDRPDIQARLHEMIRSGLSYASALSQAIAKAQQLDEPFLRQPNNILAIEYLRALSKYGQNIQPLLIQRQGADYHQVDLEYSRKGDNLLASATAIRKLVYEGNARPLAAACPSATANLLKDLSANKLPDYEKLWLPLRIVLLRSKQEELDAIQGAGEGLPNRLRHAAAESASLKEFLSTATAKRYPTSRLARLTLHTLLRFTEAEAKRFDEAGPLYARMLAARPTGLKLLHELKSASKLPFIAKISRYLNSKQREQDYTQLFTLQQELVYDTWATELREMTLPEPNNINDFQKSPIIVKD